jgi:hypothetical protein
MWMRDLKFRLAMRVVLLSALCFVAASAWLLVETSARARARAAWIAGIVARDLALQRQQTTWIRILPSPPPDLQNIAALLTAPGVCIAYRAKDGQVVQRFCGGMPAGDAEAPALFAALYRRRNRSGVDEERTIESAAVDEHVTERPAVNREVLVDRGQRTV